MPLHSGVLEPERNAAASHPLVPGQLLGNPSVSGVEGSQLWGAPGGGRALPSVSGVIPGGAGSACSARAAIHGITLASHRRELADIYGASVGVPILVGSLLSAGLAARCC